MSSIIRRGDTYHGISVFGRGVFTNDEDEDGRYTYAGQHRDGYANDEYGRRTYAGQHRDGYACGLGVLTDSDGSKVYAEHGPDGQFDGRYLRRYADGGTFHRLFERGEPKESADVYDDGYCEYNDVACAPDDPRLLALIAQVAPVEVRPAARVPHPPLAPTQSSEASAGSFCPSAGAGGRRGHRGAPPRRTPSLVAVRRSPTAAALQSTTTQ
jgi:hypothetical protein